MVKNQFSIILLFIVSLSCDSGHHTRTYQLPKTKVNTFQPPTEERVTEISSFQWEKPTLWKPTKGSSMRLASFEIPYSTGSGDLSIMELGGDGGGLEANVNRWRRQLNLDSQSLFEIEKEMIDYKGGLGDYKIIRIINEELDSAFLCAILPAGKQTLFVKLSAGPKGIREIETDFISFCSSLIISI